MERRKARVAEAAALVERVTAWAAGQPATYGLLLVGSYARNTARPESDVDFVLLTTDPDHITVTAFGTPIRLQRWGDVLEHRFRTENGLEFELNTTDPAWARRAKTDPGTRRVVTDGARVLYDPTGDLADLLSALA
ncbi:nucleotidyltransferase domain-containing protein [Amycolatopsis alkalitolerans]|uniref:Nucleotidyltransferase domain-containing protein n=1 Tax=Amycolatopsis alkalitolerans TaxID=2547244 RepID=A0A5C4M332_9PSEU|nr:nucleotidyltransferase domain-containing protein [Amycolatopsis alkalitolerans]TNC27460.1 nucleotidyltransferase domain-containing protein [Amycolatopsis alkalitolerans]